MVEKVVEFQRDPCRLCGAPIRKTQGRYRPATYCSVKCARKMAQRGNHMILEAARLWRDHYTSGKAGMGTK